ncbi:Glu/Leu/Phe/Val dehydrogenase dimerization domain-containing protein [Dactylosporangium matsuzakiense]|uniref:Leucine dehydrogenase n=1 Tax=Dactylosporangium matsuzakiense TaxID=53360 RepID=A0A9W6NN70_9ACTN|nr:Glu/Leu/Phe/Val dehydrogenase dimerization domain-containing protein [Dactylosporangium matsuzakiense]UWZ48118.1 amino acid dehydrogenase [Dactylosporangium matsuzakiense]GLL03134.1 leucine dehydrogenase [Dactylosporangium matsuzakiense]
MEHERVVIRRGVRSGAVIIIAIHSTARGPALGGCRIARYPDWRDGLEDALRLSAAMTAKCAAAGLAHGGGKTVVVGERGAGVLHDVGDLVEELGGAYATGPDVGTGPDDMEEIATRTTHVFCRPSASGDSSPATAAGVLAALRVIGGTSFAVMGLGHVGARVAGRLLDAGHRVVVSDVDESKRALFPAAEWVAPERILEADVDVLVPAALGGILTPSSVPRLRCRAVAGPANNQLDRPETAELLRARGIVWAPDHVVSAGGVIYATEVELHGSAPAAAMARVEAIGDTLRRLLDRD